MPVKRKTLKPRPGRVRADRGMLLRTGVILALCGVLVFIPVIGMFLNLMVFRHGEYSDKALENQTRSAAVTASRGTIYDRNMNVLAASAGVENVLLSPVELKKNGGDVDRIAEGLGEILNLDPQWIREQALDASMYYKVLAKKQDSTVTSRLRAFLTENDITCVHLEPDSKRYYPNGTLASQVVGFTNASNTGSEGLEAYYNKYLEGSSGRVLSARGNYGTEMPYAFEQYFEATPGCSVVSTIDATVQTFLEKNIQAAIDRYDVQHGGFGIVMDVNTGEILAMATLGGYDPNNYLVIQDPNTQAELDEMKAELEALPQDDPAREEAQTQYRQALAAARLEQWRNRCVSDGYNPGSTFKTITLAAALEEGTTTLSSTFYCGGTARFEGRSQILNCWRHQGHGSETTAEALQNSCNIAFAKIGLSLGGEKFYDYVKAFGFLEPTGIDMSGEAAGFFYDKETFYNPKATGHASALISSSFGQTFQVTPMQLVRGIAAVVNGGYVLEPYVVSEILDQEGNSLETHGRTVLRRAISQETSETMRTLIESVVTDGTARNAQLPGYRIGGKTGTSEKIGVKDAEGNQTKDKIVSFVGIAPMDDPQYIVLVALDTPRTGYVSGGQMGAPTVREVMADILPYLGVSKDESLLDPADTLTAVPDLGEMTPRQAEKALKELGLEARTVGQGETVTNQIPAAGTEIPGGSQVILYLDSEADQGPVLVPDFTGMTLMEANEAAAKAGLYIQVRGPKLSSGSVRVTAQSLGAGTETDPGTTVTLELTDTTVGD